MRVIKDRESHAAIEVDPDARLLLRLGDNSSIILQEHPPTWFETIEGVGRVEYNYDKFWRPMTLANGEPYPPVEALRKMMRGSVSAPTSYGEGVLDLVMEYLPTGDCHVFAPGLGFLGRYCCVEDAKLIARMHGVSKPVVFADLKEFHGLPVEQQSLVALAVGAPAKEKYNQRSLQEIFAMSKDAKRKKMQRPGTSPATKAQTGTGRQKPGPSRADGPVAQARAIFEKLGGKDTVAIREACAKAGINPGTTSVQLGKWRKEKGIVVERGPSKKTVAAAAPVAKGKKTTAPAKGKKAAKAEAAPKIDPVANAKPPKRKAKAKAKAAPAKTDPNAPSPSDHGDEYLKNLERVPGQDDEERGDAAGAA